MLLSQHFGLSFKKFETWVTEHSLKSHLCIIYCAGYAITSQAKVDWPWWRHQMEIFFALLVLCAVNSPVAGEFPAQRPVTRSSDVSFHLRLNKRSSKQSWGWSFETPSQSLLRHCNACSRFYKTTHSNLWSTDIQNICNLLDRHIDDLVCNNNIPRIDISIIEVSCLKVSPVKSAWNYLENIASIERRNTMLFLRRYCIRWWPYSKWQCGILSNHRLSCTIKYMLLTFHSNMRIYHTHKSFNVWKTKHSSSVASCVWKVVLCLAGYSTLKLYPYMLNNS